MHVTYRNSSTGRIETLAPIVKHCERLMREKNSVCRIVHAKRIYGD